ncbi:MAG: VWA domain-containing protein [Humibacillus sp.]|nr:VWA domain-containing protein [Humibacillus sp.]MDN5777536.1 VWA domain-containing protein [Humibacillus sp.]
MNRPVDGDVAQVRTPPDAVFLGFARALRAGGLPVTADRERVFLEAVVTTGAEKRVNVYWSGRATLTSSPADIERYDSVFTAWFSGEPLSGGGRPSDPLSVTRQAPLGDDSGDGGPSEDEIVRAASSSQEVLRHRDVGSLSSAERRELAQLFARLRPRPPVRRARRHNAARSGRIDGPATLRNQLRRMGEPGPIRHRRRATRPRRVVLLIDVSGSMSPYSDSLLRLAHTFVQSAASGMSTEVFTMGTRLTHVTRALRERDADRALVAAGQVVPDWSGGTRLGEAIAAFLDLWGRRGMARGAVVVVFSDGWEREGPEQLGEQMRRLAALSRRVVWANPHRGKVGYQPVQQGIVAALPHIDDFVAGHSFAAFEELIEVVARA